jgi:RNA polymerase sigma-70 factor, ECF subfamily
MLTDGPVAPQEDITALLHRFRDGDKQARSKLITTLYNELRIMAARYMRRERDGHTLQTTALINEAYMRLVSLKNIDWQDRAHFFAVAATVMRGILVDHARKHVAGKRGAGIHVLPLNEGLVFSPERAEPLLRLDEGLRRLSAHDERAGQVIELRFFGGLSIEETAAVLGTSARTVKREWAFARAWLRTELALGQDQPHGPATLE